jgi:hypothetical protein
MVVSLALVSCSVADAATITFDNLSGPNEGPFTSYQEAGFSVTAAGGFPEQGTVFGNPAPSVIIGAPVFAPVPGTVTVRLTAGGPFTFTSMDLASNNGVNSSFSAVGILDGSPVFTFAGLVPSISGFSFVTETNPVQEVIDTLNITVIPGIGVTSDNLDNIDATVVPEPSTVILVGLGLGASLLRRRLARRRGYRVV